VFSIFLDIGTGEHIDNLELFEEKTFVSKLLGMGDIQASRLLIIIYWYSSNPVSVEVKNINLPVLLLLGLCSDFDSF